MTLKKALVAITVVAMLFGMVGTAFAATSFPDVTDSKTAAAASRLSALKIVTGYPDGNFGAADTVTRAQFAAIAVRALGLDSAATYAKGATKFSDVAADYWASGYVNIATQQGVINGYPDGKFGPDDKVTYAQALTMVVRMLGYAPVVEGRGMWPANYIAKAAQLGFTNGVAFNGSEFATRGNIALFVDGSLTVDLMMETGVSNNLPVYSVATGHNLLTDYLKASKVSGQLTSSPDLLGVIQVTIQPTTGGPFSYDVASGITVPAGLLGQNVNVWLDGNGDAFFVQSTESASNVITDKISSYTAGTSIGLSAAAKTYTIASGALVFGNGQTTVTPAAGNEVTVVLNANGEAKAIVATGYTAGVVSDVDVDGKIITTTAGDSLVLSGADKSITITKDGKAIGVGDVKQDDVVNYYTDGSGNYVVIVTTKTATGTLSQVNADGTAVIGGTKYSKATQVEYYSSNTSFADYMGDNVKVYLDKYGKVARIETVGTTATSAYAVVKGTGTFAVGTPTGVDYYVKVMKSDGTAATLKLASKVNGVDASTISLAADTVIKYTVDSTGAIDTYTTQALGATVFTLDSVNSLVNSKLVTSGTIIFDLRTAGSPATLTSSDFFKLSGVTGTIVADSSVTARAAVILVGAGTGAASTPYAYVTAVYQDSNGWHATVFTGGSTVTYAVYDQTVASEVYVGSSYALNLSGATIVAPEVAQTDINAAVSGWDHNVALSYDSTNKILTYKTVKADKSMIATQYTLFNADTMFVDNTGAAPVISTSDAIKAGKTVELYDFDANGIVDIVVVD